MKKRNYLESDGHPYRRRPASRGLAVAVLVSIAGMTGFGSAHAQSTTGKIHGQAPAGGTVTVQNDTGVHRRVTVGNAGSYNMRMLPLGIYTVTLEKDGKPVDRQANIPLTAGGGAEVDFACPHDQCAANK